MEQAATAQTGYTLATMLLSSPEDNTNAECVRRKHKCSFAFYNEKVVERTGCKRALQESCHCVLEQT